MGAKIHLAEAPSFERRIEGRGRNLDAPKQPKEEPGRRNNAGHVPDPAGQGDQKQDQNAEARHSGTKDGPQGLGVTRFAAGVGEGRTDKESEEEIPHRISLRSSSVDSSELGLNGR